MYQRTCILATLQPMIVFFGLVTTCQAEPWQPPKIALSPAPHHPALAPSYLLVFDALTSDTPHRFDWTYHNLAAAVKSNVARQAAGHLGDGFAGQEYITNVKQGINQGPIAIQFIAEDLTTHLSMAGAPDTTVRVGNGVGQSVADRVPMVVITRHGADAKFAAVLEPVAKGQRPQVTAVDVNNTKRGTEVTIRRQDQVDVVTLTKDHRVSLTVDGRVISWPDPITGSAE